MDNVLIYMDCCCFNRPSDDQAQDKIYIESDVIIAILLRCSFGPWRLIGSDVLEYEIMKTPDQNKEERAFTLYRIKKESISIDSDIVSRAEELQKFGLKAIDSLHFASAEKGCADMLLTFDQDFIKNSKGIHSSLRVENPITWFMEITENE
jgi:predicted nucleic acid-binding protein